jgi:hypothetical protein
VWPGKQCTDFPVQWSAAEDVDKAWLQQRLPASAAARWRATVPTAVSSVTTAAAAAAAIAATTADWLGAGPSCPRHLDPL